MKWFNKGDAIEIVMVEYGKKPERKIVPLRRDWVENFNYNNSREDGIIIANMKLIILYDYTCIFFSYRVSLQIILLFFKKKKICFFFQKIKLYLYV